MANDKSRPGGHAPDAGQSAPGAVTQMLLRWQQGDAQAFSELAPLVYAELKAHARRYLRHERPDHTLQGTALVHEALLRLMHGEPVKWTSRAHFLHLVSKLMRRILVDHARTRLAAKRNSGMAAVSLDEIREKRIPSDPDMDLDQLLGGTLVNQDV